MRLRRARPPLVVALVALGGGALGCSGDDAAPVTTAPPAAATTTTPTTTTTTPTTTATPTTSSATTTLAPTTTLDPAEVVTTYAEPGSHPVGVTTLTLPTGNPVEVWYPATEGTPVGELTYDVRDFVPPAISDILTGDVPTTFAYAGARDAEVAPGMFPVVLFSHGFSGFRLQSTFLTSHLASWGFVVAAPDHPSRDLANVLGATASGDRASAVAELLATLDLLAAAGDDPTSAFSGHVDVERVVAVGHSAGGGTVLGAAEDPRIDGYVSMASGAALGGGGATATTTAMPSLPDRPSFFIAGSVDGIVPAEERTRPAFEAAPAPSLLWILEGVGHNGFDDFCTFGGGTGIIGVAEASGLSGFLDTQPQLRALGEDGCIPPAVPVERTFPVIRHGVTAWIRATLGIDPAAIGLGAEHAGAHAVPVVVESRA